MENLIPTLAVGFAVSVAVLMLGWQFGRSRKMLNTWAADHGYRILDAENRWFRRGPFFWTSGKGQTVYRIMVRDRDGDTREGWARCGSYWMGLLSDQVEVRWDHNW